MEVDDAFKDSLAGGIKDNDFAEEFPSELPSMAMPSAPSGCSLYASLQLPPVSKFKEDDGRKKLEHAPPGETMHIPRLGTMIDSLERPPVVSARNHDVAPGAFPVRSSRNTVTSRTFRSPSTSNDYTGEFPNEESKQEEGMPTSAGAFTGTRDSSRMAAGSDLYMVEAQLVTDGNEEGTSMVPETKSATVKWCRRLVAAVVIIAALAVAAIIIAVAFGRPPSASSSSSSTSPTPVPFMGASSTPNPMAGALPTSMPTTVTPVGTACNFLSIPDVTECRSTFEFDAYNNEDDTTTGSTIPTEIGLLTQLTYLDFNNIKLTSTVPSEIGLLTQLTYLSFAYNAVTSAIPSEIGLLTRLTTMLFTSNELNSTIPSEIGLSTQLKLLYFWGNALTSTIPSEIGLLTQLTHLSLAENELIGTIPTEIALLTKLDVLLLSDNELTGTIPSSLCSLPSLKSRIFISCGEIACASGCCSDMNTFDGTSFSCG